MFPLASKFLHSRNQLFSTEISKMGELPELGMPPNAEDHPDSFFKSIRTPVILTQFFGLLPVAGISGPNYKSLKFEWMHWKVFYSMFALGGITFIFICSIAASFLSGFSFNMSVTVVIYGSKILASCLLLQIARKWPKMNEDFAEMEFKFKKYGYPSKTKLKFQIIAAVYLTVAVAERVLVEFLKLIRSKSCAEMGDNIGSVVEAYFVNYYYQVFSVVSYSHCKGLLTIYFHYLSVFTSIFMDLFLSLISLSISQRFKQLNEVLFQIQGQEMPSSFWRTVREDYNELSLLVKKIDVYVQKLILLSMTDNLYIICLMMLNILQATYNIYGIIRLLLGLAFLIIRTALVCFCAAGINDESKEAKRVLYSAPDNGYCMEANRLLTQLTSDEIALTGCRFFSVTRGLILTMVGIVITYEIILLQFYTQTDVDGWPTKTSKTLCAHF